ncbi:8114_t:CDS:2 [Paraglomus brasilianum]|uniref:8114_t:CDS:1 n=1 Tax=Paraglomus brasilianum TaxID=144538 RepID=A0A9N9DK81_9GLOM|nr:8114_t:CDS:2 [Paraglomus brasilianum]
MVINFRYHYALVPVTYRRWLANVRKHRRLIELNTSRVVAIRAGLEQVRNEINKEDREKWEIDFRKPVDNTLAQLVDDGKFKDYLKKFCEKHRQDPKAVTDCIGGLYHHASKGFTAAFRIK